MVSILAASALTCRAPAVHDGDSLRYGQELIRIANIDAPDPGDLVLDRNSWPRLQRMIPKVFALSRFFRRCLQPTALKPRWTLSTRTGSKWSVFQPKPS